MDILLVDDSKVMRMVVKRTIRQAGFDGLSFDEASDGAEALTKLQADTPRLILSDWNMPNMTGIEFLKKVRASNIAVPFGFITSEGSDEIRATAEECGANFLITKPFTPDEIQNFLSPVLGA